MDSKSGVPGSRRFQQTLDSRWKGCLWTKKSESVIVPARFQMQSHSLDVFGAKREDTLRIFKVFLLLGSHIEPVQIRWPATFSRFYEWWTDLVQLGSLGLSPGNISNQTWNSCPHLNWYIYIYVTSFSGYVYDDDYIYVYTHIITCILILHQPSIQTCMDITMVLSSLLPSGWGKRGVVSCGTWKNAGWVGINVQPWAMF